MTEKKREVLSHLELQNFAALISDAEAAAVRGGGGDTPKPQSDPGDADGLSG